MDLWNSLLGMSVSVVDSDPQKCPCVQLPGHLYVPDTLDIKIFIAILLPATNEFFRRYSGEQELIALH